MEATAHDGDHAGWVYKQGNLVRNWKKRFMVLRGAWLTYYDTETLRKEMGSFEAVAVKRWPDVENGLLGLGPTGRALKLHTDSREESEAWYDAVAEAADRHSSVQHSGWLEKKEADGGWQRLWFTLRHCTLSSFVSEETGSEAVDSGVVRAVELVDERENTFEIELDGGRLLCVAASTDESMREWLMKLRTKSAQDEHEGMQESDAVRQNIVGPTKPSAAESTQVPFDVSAAVEYVEESVESIDVFQAAEASTGLWSEPVLLSKRIPSDELTTAKPLSTGVFGDVWLGAHIDDTPVVVKRLKPDMELAANATRFATEIVRMAQLSHPKITEFVGVEWTKQWATSAVVEYLPRGDLRVFLGSSDGADLGWADFKCQVAMDVVDALEYLHGTTDAAMETFTSRNVLLEGDDGRCKLSVFAAARGRQDGSSAMQYVEWLAPEIILRNNNSDPAKSAIYSLGVLLCELDTMKPPFFDALNPDGSPMSSAKIAQLVSLGKLRPSVSAECPEGIASLASECLAFDPNERPTAASVAYRLRHVLKNEL